MFNIRHHCHATTDIQLTMEAWSLSCRWQPKQQWRKVGALWNTNYWVHPDTFLPVIRSLSERLQLAHLKHLYVVGIELLILSQVPHSIVSPELPIECLPWFLEGPEVCPTPRGTKIVSVPEKEVCECCTKSQICSEQVDHPCRRIPRKSLLREQRWVDLVVWIEDQGLIILRSVLIVKQLRKLARKLNHISWISESDLRMGSFEPARRFYNILQQTRPWSSHVIMLCGSRRLTYMQSM